MISFLSRRNWYWAILVSNDAIMGRDTQVCFNFKTKFRHAGAVDVNMGGI